MAIVVKQPTTMTHKLKVGDYVYLKDVGFPYDRIDNGHESWEGASCQVIALNAGYNGNYIRVRALYPILCGNGKSMQDCVFLPQCCIPEDRPWLLANLTRINNAQNRLLEMADEIQACFTRR